MTGLSADEPGDYLLVHTEHGAELWRQVDGDDAELVDLVQPVTLPMIPRKKNSAQGSTQNRMNSVATTTIVDSAVLPTT